MPLSDTKVKSTKPAAKDYKLADEKGLFLLVTTKGQKRWRMKYRVDGKEKLLALGVYPDVTLAQAREQRNAARSLLAKGIDPMAQRKAIKAARQDAVANSFEVITREWIEKRGDKSERENIRLNGIILNDLFPAIGHLPIADITPLILLQALRKIEGRGALETARRARQYASQIFRYAVATGRAERDTAADLRGALKSPVTRHFAAITSPKEAGQLLANIHSYQGSPVVVAALKLAPLLFCRPGELRHLEWSEVNFDEKRIEIPAHKMKMKEPHIIPLASQAIDILTGIRAHTFKSKYVFPNGKTLARPLSE
ncbi:MAG: integrase arm-type DNA-binding domain-containing protein, partial [Chloroflexota bacterium]